MSGAVTTLLAGAVFGLALAAPPGPMNAVIAEESVLRGWLAGAMAGLGAMTADACFLALAYVGAVGVVARVPALRTVMIGVGGLLMLSFAYGAVRDASSFSADGAGVDAADGNARRGFGKALALALTNPYQILFWVTVGVRLLEPGTVDVLAHVPSVGGPLAGLLLVRTGSPALVVGLFAGIGVWVIGFPATLVGLGRRIDRFVPAVAYASAAVLVVFGGWFLLDAVTPLLVALGR